MNAAFSYLFPELVGDPAAHLPYGPGGELLPEIRDALRRLALGMADPDGGSASGNSTTLPAGFTYLGQFLAHDLVHDPLPLPSGRVDIATLVNLRSPRLDLDSVYGAGPQASPFMYDVRGPSAGAVLRVGSGANTYRDLPRAGDGIALAGDARNDENLLIAQLHVAHLHLHNQAVWLHTSGAASWRERFAEARTLVVRHYQWLVVERLLKRVAEAAVVNDALALVNGPPMPPAIPVEFSLGALRFGHSMVRDRYNVNIQHLDAPLGDLFSLTGMGSGGTPNVVPTEWVVDWKRFFGAPDDALVPGVNPARRIDTTISASLYAAPSPGGAISVPEGTLLRGYAYGLPTGEAVAGELGVAPLSAAAVAAMFNGTGGIAYPAELSSKTPLWYYVLAEAKAVHGGEQLGRVGSRILAAVIIGLLRADPASYLNTAGWQPSLGSAAGSFSCVEMLKAAGVWL